MRIRRVVYDTLGMRDAVKDHRHASNSINRAKKDRGNTVENMGRFARVFYTPCDTPECKKRGIYIWRGKHFCSNHRPVVVDVGKYEY